MTLGEYYQFVDEVIAVCDSDGKTQAANDLRQAKFLGSSGLEIAGATSQVLIKLSEEHDPVVDRNRLKAAIKFVTQLYSE